MSTSWVSPFGSVYMYTVLGCACTLYTIRQNYVCIYVCMWLCVALYNTHTYWQRGKRIYTPTSRREVGGGMILRDFWMSSRANLDFGYHCNRWFSKQREVPKSYMWCGSASLVTTTAQLGRALAARSPLCRRCNAPPPGRQRDYARWVNEPQRAVR